MAIELTFEVRSLSAWDDETREKLLLPVWSAFLIRVVSAEEAEEGGKEGRNHGRRARRVLPHLSSTEGWR